MKCLHWAFSVGMKTFCDRWSFHHIPMVSVVHNCHWGDIFIAYNNDLYRLCMPAQKSSNHGSWKCAHILEPIRQIKRIKISSPKFLKPGRQSIKDQVRLEIEHLNVYVGTMSKFWLQHSINKIRNSRWQFITSNGRTN